MVEKYHAVKILQASNACECAKQVRDVRFLSHEAPLLPMPGCTNPSGCKCRYQHYKDRRVGPRRDADVGLHSQHWEFNEKRRRGNFRRSTDGLSR